jgi:hypothetical protein
MAGMPRAAHTEIKSSGRVEPSRKLKAERAWSSTYKLSVLGSQFSARPFTTQTQDTERTPKFVHRICCRLRTENPELTTGN